MKKEGKKKKKYLYPNYILIGYPNVKLNYSKNIEVKFVFIIQQ